MSRSVPPLGAHPTREGLHFRVRAPQAERVELCLFDGDHERRLEMARDGEDFTLQTDARPGQRYGHRADGPWRPDDGLWFDPDKLLVDPYAVELDRAFVQDARLAAPRGEGGDTAALVPKAIAPAPRETPAPSPPVFTPGSLIYELNVRGFTKRHPDVPEARRGTIAALAEPAVIAHLQKLRVSAVELMPVTAWIDEPHLGPLGLANAWGYNPVTMMALDPRLAPGGPDELARTVAALREAGIGVILDLVFNHTGEGGAGGPILSLRGLDNLTAYAHAPDKPGELSNDSGCGNTLACWQDATRALVLASVRRFASLGVDGFRFDLAPVLARTPEGFDPNARIFADIAADPVLSTRVMIAEPWDIGPGGYQLGQLPAPWLEWSDRYRDDVRCFWKGEGSLGGLATRLTGSSDLFGHDDAKATRTVNFIAAHDGFTLADMVSYEQRHNAANGEDNRDGHGDNHSWNGGAEGPTDDEAIKARRAADLRALLATLFASRGTIMLTAGDEFARTQGGNNNAYAQDNETTWVDWESRDRALEDFTAQLAAFRAAHPKIAGPAFVDDDAGIASVEWFALDGAPMDDARWNDPEAAGLEMRLRLADGARLSVRLDRAARTGELAFAVGGR
jgi:glycogen operon protein